MLLIEKIIEEQFKNLKKRKASKSSNFSIHLHVAPAFFEKASSIYPLLNLYVYPNTSMS